MRVLVTGASGFLGGRLAGALVEEGHDVRALVRDPASQLPPGVRPLRGDVREAARLTAAAAGCDWIVHAASLVKMWVRERGEFDRVNVDGASHAVQAARASGARLAYVSSFLALGPTDGGVLDEDAPRRSTTFHNDYERTKTLADRLLRRVDPASVHLVRLYPGVLYGPGRLTAGNHIVSLLLEHARGRLPGLVGPGDRRWCFTYVDDAVRGMLQAMAGAPAGAGYILGGENRTTLELFAAFERATGLPPPARRVPYAAAAWIGRLQRARARLLGIAPTLTDEVVGIYRHEWAYSSARAERELDYRITPLEEGVARTVAWLRSIGELAR